MMKRLLLLFCFFILASCSESRLMAAIPVSNFYGEQTDVDLAAAIEKEADEVVVAVDPVPTPTPIPTSTPEPTPTPEPENVPASVEIDEPEIYTSDAEPPEVTLPPIKQEDTTPKKRDGAYITGKSDDNRVYITFDDGPDEKVTERVLDVLSQYDVKATFFFIGRYVDRYPETVKRAYDEGHCLGGHTYNHIDLSKASREKIIDEVNKTSASISTITNDNHPIIRPPFGAINNTLISIAEEINSTIVNWSVDPRDWDNKDGGKILSVIKQNIKPGSIILLHSYNAMDATADILPEIIEYIKSQGYTFDTLDNMF